MEKYSFFNDVSGDRVYYAEDFARHLAKYFTNGIFDNGCQVLGNIDDMAVNVSVGSANINGYRYDNDTIKTLTIENADGTLNRIDNIVIRLDLTNRNITTQVIKGTFADNPIAPNLVRTSTIYDLRLAKVYIPAGTTEITQDLVEDCRFITSDCGNVISAVQTADTENLFIQIQSIFDNTISDMTDDFETWFATIKNKLDGDTAGNIMNLINQLVDNDLKSEKLTLNVNNWKLNSSTDLYEYTIEKENITSNTLVSGNLDIENQPKLNDACTLSFNNGFKVITSKLPTENIDITFTYEIANYGMEG